MDMPASDAENAERKQLMTSQLNGFVSYVAPQTKMTPKSAVDAGSKLFLRVRVRVPAVERNSKLFVLFHDFASTCPTYAHWWHTPLFMETYCYLILTTGIIHDFLPA